MHRRLVQASGWALDIPVILVSRMVMPPTRWFYHLGGLSGSSGRPIGCVSQITTEGEFRVYFEPSSRHASGVPSGRK